MYIMCKTQKDWND